MKIKLLLMLVVTSLIFSIVPCNLSFASEPEITREYISRKIDGEKSKEERVSVNYENLHIEKGVYLRVTFLDKRNSKIYEYKVELSVDDLFQNKLPLNSNTLKGTKYVEIEISGPDSVYNGVKVPFEI